MSDTLFDRIVVPVATEADAQSTCEAALSHLRQAEGKAYIVHAIEKTSDAPDKASLEQRQQVAEDIFHAASTSFEAAGFTNFETRLLDGADVVATLLDVCDEIDATAVVFVTREASRWKRLLSGGVTLKLITKNPCPALVLPEPNND